MPYVHANIAKKIVSPDGKAVVEILKRHDGLYEYRETVERAGDPDYEGERYWSPGQSSGLYETIEEVERAAFNDVPWLRSQKSK
ncbi:MAG: hypothetical protein Q7V17_19285 [Afipia sp.]|nr:hypothetical protein [Afipia sp.]